MLWQIRPISPDKSTFGVKSPDRGYSAGGIDELSDRLVNNVVAHGDPATIGVKVREHVAAGADHVMLLPPTGGDFPNGVDRLEQIALAYPA
ncbi:MAG: hypothetical protein QOD10_4787 [Mycobacterium sp.]|nr:hypothetical protein [Mycobacterium sp.]